MKASKPARTASRRRRNLAGRVLKKLSATTDKRMRLKIIQAVARLKQPWTEAVLVESLGDPSEEIRDFLVEELGGRPELELSRICAQMGIAPWYRKSCCLKILGKHRDPKFVKLIEPLLDDPNVDVKRTAAHVLGEIGGRDALALLARLVRDENQFVKISAEKALLKASDLKFS